MNVENEANLLNQWKKLKSFMLTNKHDEEMTLKMILLSNARSTK